MAWPTSIAGDSDLFLAKNNVYSSLNGAINSAVTSIVLTDASAFPTVGFLSVDNEVISYTGKSTNTLTGCTRGADGTTAASHTDGRIAMHRVVAGHHNALKTEIIAIETSLTLTAGRAVATNGGTGHIEASAATATELGYLSGVTSAIQTQLNLKAPLASPTFSGTITTALTSSRALVTGAGSELSASAATATEVSYLSGVTSAIQTQMNLKAPIASPVHTGTVTAPNLAITDTSNQLVIGTTRTVTLTAPTPASSSRTVTIPDLSANYSLVGTEAAQTINGVKTFATQMIAAGTATNDSASAGQIGEYITSAVTATNFPTSGQYGDMTSVSLTAGDWDVDVAGMQTYVAGTLFDWRIGLSSTSGNSSTGLTNGTTQLVARSAISGGPACASIPRIRVSLSATTTYYLKVYSGHDSTAPTFDGRITARRVR